MRPRSWFALGLMISMVGPAAASGDEPSPAKRPRITGVAHLAIYAHDVDKSLAFYGDYLGYAEPYRLTTASGGLQLTFLKINERQYLEVFPEKTAGSDRLNHIALETDDAEAMRAYLASRGVKVPAKVGLGRIGNANFTITDPDGHTVEIVEYRPEGWTLRERGKFLPEARVSGRAMHVGIAVGSLDRAMAFYRDILGFAETWRGSANGQQLSWVNMKVPDGDDYVEFMLYKGDLSTARLGVMHHLCLEVPDIEASKKALEARPAHKAYTRPLEVRTGINRKRQLNLFDPDGTRIELMEPRTVDGTPTPPSDAPAP